MDKGIRKKNLRILKGKKVMEKKIAVQIDFTAPGQGIQRHGKFLRSHLIKTL